MGSNRGAGVAVPAKGSLAFVVPKIPAHGVGVKDNEVLCLAGLPLVLALTRCERPATKQDDVRAGDIGSVPVPGVGWRARHPES